MVGVTLSLFGQDQEHGHSAVLSPCRTWRYALERRWSSGPPVLFIGLNPSTADEHVDDPTIRRCVGYAKAWGMGKLFMANLYGYRATKPADLLKAEDPIGPDTDVWLSTLAVRSSFVVAAWGSHKSVTARAQQVLELVGEVHALRLTKDGHPAHPLYLPKDLRPSRWSGYVR